MARPMIATKLYVPQLRRPLVARPRLSERLRHGAQSRLTLLSAPAGFGKTTLLAEWLGATPGEDRFVAWLSLDPADNDPASFWTGVVTALQTAVPGVGTAALELLASPQTPVPDRPGAHHRAQRARRCPELVWLVLDDYHLVDNRDVRDGMAFLLEHLPPARARRDQHAAPTPTCRWPRWRVRGELVEIRAADLRFTSEEAAAYLNEVTGLGLAAEDVAALETTHGGVDCRASARRALAPGARRRRRFHRPVRRERPVHRRLPGRGGAEAPT